MKPKIVFWGSPEFSIPTLEACAKYAEILAVVSQPDKERGRGQELLPTAVKAWALKHNLKCYTPKSLRKVDDQTTELMGFLQQREADFYVVVAYGNLLPESVLNLPLKAPVNIHASLLPRWRGAAPVQRALAAGDKEGGISLQRMVSELDAGDVYLEKKLSISEEENAEGLFQKFSLLSAELIEDFLKADFHSFVPTKQNSDQITLAKKIQKAEAIWSGTWSAEDFHNKVRAFHLWPTLRILFKDVAQKIFEVKILKSRIVTNPSPILHSPWGLLNGQALLKCHDGRYVEVLLAQFPGKGPVTGALLFEKLQKDKFELSL